MATETTRCPRLIDQVRDRGRVKHFSLRTEQAYVHWIRRFIVFRETRDLSGMVPRE